MLDTLVNGINWEKWSSQIDKDCCPIPATQGFKGH